jgi:hypothetical protein
MTVDEAEAFAMKAHDGQFGKFDDAGQPYWWHLARVAHRVRTLDEKVVAWLHDVLEDTETSEADLVAAGATPEQLEAIRLLTRDDYWAYLTYIGIMVGEGSPLALRVKLADLDDHLRDESRLPPALAVRYKLARKSIAEALEKAGQPA